MTLIDKEKAIENIEDIVATVSVCLTVDEATGMMRMKNEAIKSLTNESPVLAIPVAWIIENYNINNLDPHSTNPYSVLIQEWMKRQE